MRQARTLRLGLRGKSPYETGSRQSMHSSRRTYSEYNWCWLHQHQSELCPALACKWPETRPHPTSNRVFTHRSCSTLCVNMHYVIIMRCPQTERTCHYPSVRLCLSSVGSETFRKTAAPSRARSKNSFNSCSIYLTFPTYRCNLFPVYSLADVILQRCHIKYGIEQICSAILDLFFF